MKRTVSLLLESKTQLGIGGPISVVVQEFRPEQQVVRCVLIGGLI
jgi:hypothetical protein